MFTKSTALDVQPAGNGVRLTRSTPDRYARRSATRHWATRDKAGQLESHSLGAWERHGDRHSDPYLASDASSSCGLGVTVDGGYTANEGGTMTSSIH